METVESIEKLEKELEMETKYLEMKDMYLQIIIISGINKIISNNM